jgi:hypothetical protein
MTWRVVRRPRAARWAAAVLRMCSTLLPVLNAY